MKVLECIDKYIENAKETPTVYSMQQNALADCRQYIDDKKIDFAVSKFTESIFEKFLLVYVPKTKKYLTEEMAYQYVYTLNKLENYIYTAANSKKPKEATLLDKYGEEFMRIYKSRDLLGQLTGNPYRQLSKNTMLIDFDKYRSMKERIKKQDLATTYESALYLVEEVKEGGQVIFVRATNTSSKQYKALLEFPCYKYIKKGDILFGTLKRKLFYVYWEIDALDVYYPAEAKELLTV